MFDGLQREDLVEGLVIGDEACLDEVAAGLMQGERIHGQTLHERVLGVVAESLAIGHSDQKQVEGCGRMREGVDVVLTDQSVIQPAEPTGDLPDTLWTDGMLLNHHCLLWFGLDH